MALETWLLRLEKVVKTEEEDELSGTGKRKRWMDVRNVVTELLRDMVCRVGSRKSLVAEGCRSSEEKLWRKRK